ncbi:hypothetical protein [Leifsonia poae]|uniref:Uncharacterized protein n=1 Tax=Leifsonia poae TaxID=110933 RepID=A0A9W6M0R1_9MICO|nr:hypothetical protein [Leifsonia poae]GLJ76997.1 hypothetical protein GCM10017584_25710 [Leifsonia poae]
MGGDETDGSPAHPLAALSPRTRVALLWSGIAVLLLLAFFAAVGALQRGPYSAGGFVSAYLDSLADHDVNAALSMPGADPTAPSLRAQGLPSAPSRELLRSDVLPSLTGIRIVSDDDLGTGEHLVAVQAKADGHPVAARFSVRQTGAVLGLLPTWRFAATPLTVARITVEHADTFTVGGHTLEPRAAADLPPDAFSVAADYLVFAPAVYSLGHSDQYTEAKPVTLTARMPGRQVEVSVVAQPNAAFVEKTEKQLDAYLDGCAEQHVLQPTGCPFGVVIDDRVEGVPTWKIVKYPPVTITAGERGWMMPDSQGIAHLSVTVQSLFDGTVTKRESDEPFAVSLSTITIRDDGGLDITVAD